MQVDFLVFEADENIRALLQEEALRGCFVKFLANKDEAMKQLSRCDLKFFDSFVVGDPLWRGGKPLEDWTFLGKALRHKAPGRKIVSFSIDIDSMGRSDWADYNIQKPKTGELSEALATIRKEVELFRLQESERLDKEQSMALRDIIFGEMLSRPGRSVEELFPVVSQKFDKVMSDRGQIMLYPDYALKSVIRQAKAGLLY
ncbi:MAG: hypothetical protein PHW72_03620 [Candidatus Pacebacteria bacterium]|nr:hypothetical protein [Candidatus Paceibacterota bacterium]